MTNQDTSAAAEEDHGHKGTFVLLMIHLVLIISMWVSIYYLMIVGAVVLTVVIYGELVWHYLPIPACQLATSSGEPAPGPPVNRPGSRKGPGSVVFGPAGADPAPPTIAGR